MRIKNTLVLFTVLLILWILFNNTFNLLVIGIGAALSLLFAILFCRSCMIFSEINLSPKSFFYTFIYLMIFIKEMVVSNLDMALRVLRPSLPINPGIVKVRTTLKSPMARLILADSITLTPGTFTVEIIEEYIYIHWIDVKSENIEAATEAIVRKFEKYLEVMYGK